MRESLMEIADLHVMFVNTLGGLKFAISQVETPAFHLRIIGQRREPVVETADDGNVSNEIIY